MRSSVLKSVRLIREAKGTTSVSQGDIKWDVPDNVDFETDVSEGECKYLTALNVQLSLIHGSELRYLYGRNLGS